MNQENGSIAYLFGLLVDGLFGRSRNVGKRCVCKVWLPAVPIHGRRLSALFYSRGRKGVG